MDITSRNANMKEFFDRKADGYDNVHIKYMATKAAMTPVLAENTEKVLDLGAGTGMELIPLYERFPNVKVTAVDLSSVMMEAIKSRPFGDKVTLIAGDFFTVDFGGGYDAAISTSSLHHFDEPNKLNLYRKIYAALKDGGRFVNSDKIVPDQQTQDTWLGYWENDPTMMHHIDTPLTPENERKLLLAAGFSAVEVLPTTEDDYRLFIATK